MENKKIPIVCTYGQINLAGLVLLDLINQSIQTIYYSGDCDPEGILIADKLKSRYNDKLKFIGFDKQTYIKNISKVQISEERLKKLNKVKNEELKELAKLIEENKKASYEELNINNIIKLI